MPNLSSLPEEILLMICQRAIEPTLRSLVRTDRTFYRIASPVLYNSLPGDEMFRIFQWAGGHGLEQPMLHLIPGILHKPPREPRLEIKLFRRAIGNGTPSVPGRSFPTVIHRLLQYGASPNPDAQGALLSDLTPLMQIAQDGQNPDCVPIVQMLLAAGADIHYLHSTKQAAIHFAARGGNAAVLSELVNAGADVNHNHWMTRIAPLRSAVNAGHLPAVQFLVNHGANVNHAEVYGFTPLMTAAERGSLSIVDFLVSNGADLNTQNGEGRTALHCAAIAGTRACAERLVDADCDRTIQDNDSRLALDHCDGIMRLEIKKAILRGPRSPPPPQWGSA